MQILWLCHVVPSFQPRRLIWNFTEQQTPQFYNYFSTTWKKQNIPLWETTESYIIKHGNVMKLDGGTPKLPLKVLQYNKPKQGITIVSNPMINLL